MKEEADPVKEMRGKIYFNIFHCFSLYKFILNGNKLLYFAPR